MVVYIYIYPHTVTQQKWSDFYEINALKNYRIEQLETK